jgi:sigma-B regulation protein RsbU (phosphoserine phosphatase)
MKIFVVDDNEDSRDLTEAVLMSAGYDDIAMASSAWEALKVLDVGRTTDEPPAVDLVLLDIIMPEMDGIEACARIRKDRRCADLPIIMVTSLDDMDHLANAFVAGATDYVTKPIKRVELVARVRAALKLKAELDRRQARERELLNCLSSSGDRRATLWIDEATGLFVGEVAEAYLTAESKDNKLDGTVSIVCLALDGFDVYRTIYGEAESQGVLARVAQAVRRLAATIGIVAAAYGNGMIVLVAPECGADAARQLGEALRNAVARLRLPHTEAITADHVTASVAAVTGKVQRGIDRVQLLTLAISNVQNAAAAGGNRVLAVSI